MDAADAAAANPAPTAAHLCTLLQRARALAAAESSADDLRRLLRALCPGRERVAAAGGDCARRVPLRRARAAELLGAIEGEVALALRRVPGARCAYREAELLHRAAASAAASGALDLGSGSSSSAAVARLRGGAVCALLAHPGAYLLPRALSRRAQEGLVRSSLRAHIERPNRRNLDAFADPDLSNVEWAARHGQGSSHLQPRRGAAAAVAQAGGFCSGLWAEYAAAAAAAGAGAGAPPAGLPIDALSWATLGFQYDWTARAYHLPEDADYAAHAHGSDGAGRWRAPFPPCLQALCKGLVAGLGQAVEEGVRSGALPVGAESGSSASDASAWGLPLSLHAQAAIVNVYRGEAKLRLPMGGHSDNMERTMARPVVSLSLGAPAVFLLGGATKDAPPTPLLLRSGDVLVLAGAARAAYHGVPRVFEAEGSGGLFEGGSGEGEGEGEGAGEPEAWRAGSAEEEAAFQRFMAGCRININVRQVVEEAVDP